DRHVIRQPPRGPILYSLHAKIIPPEQLTHDHWGKVHPVANAVINGVSGGVLFVGPSEFGMGNQPNEGAQQAKIASEYWSAAKDHDRAYNVNVQSGIPGAKSCDPDEWDTWVRAGSRQGFNEAVGAGHQMATELTSGDQVKNLRPEDDD
ncbi:hypothetical protein, partial [Streptomyces sp. NPDC007063]|uniref:hypothetical protein n=1 Tax=Streptomyces sp. NPDC007063 TaxID=3364772 RepID=UPI00369D4819